jgi:hypothetical protein
MSTSLSACERCTQFNKGGQTDTAYIASTQRGPNALKRNQGMALHSMKQHAGWRTGRRACLQDCTLQAVLHAGKQEHMLVGRQEAQISRSLTSASVHSYHTQMAFPSSRLPAQLQCLCLTAWCLRLSTCHTRRSSFQGQQLLVKCAM